MLFVWFDKMKPMGIVGALAGGAIGAVVWGLLGAKADIELGYVAWGVGLAVGALSYLLGGRGLTNGIICSVVTLLSIFVGKILIAKFSPGGGEASMGEIIEWIKKNLDAIDLIFAGLGVVTAFQLGGRVEAEAPAYSAEQMAYQPPPTAPDQGQASGPAQPYQPYGGTPVEPAPEPEEPKPPQNPQ